VDKAAQMRMKAGVAKDLTDLVYARKNSEHESWIEGRGAIKMLELVLSQQMDCSKALDKQLEDKEITDSEFKVAKNLAANMMGTLIKVTKITDSEMAKVKPRQEAYDRVLKDMDTWYAQKLSQADGEEVRQAELDAEEADAGEAAKREATAARIEAEKAKEKTAPKKKTPAKKPAAKKPAPQGKGTSPPLCKHCKEPVDPPTGGPYCSACASYKNRHSKLPPPDVIKKRKK